MKKVNSNFYVIVAGIFFLVWFVTRGSVQGFQNIPPPPPGSCGPDADACLQKITSAKKTLTDIQSRIANLNMSIAQTTNNIILEKQMIAQKPEIDRQQYINVQQMYVNAYASYIGNLGRLVSSLTL
jgi:hypothetical protein